MLMDAAQAVNGIRLKRLDGVNLPAYDGLDTMPGP
jgi:hypothetical protein